MFKKDIREYDVRKDMWKQTQKILKNKKITANQKAHIIVDGYCQYINERLEKDAYMSNLELNYEHFMFEDNKGVFQNDIKFERCLNFEIDNFLFVCCVELSNALDNLTKQEDFDFKCLSDYDKVFLSKVYNMKTHCNFNEEFDGSLFYTNKNFRERILINIKPFYCFVTESYVANNQDKEEGLVE